MIKVLIGIFLVSSVFDILVPYNGVYIFKISLFSIILYSIVIGFKQKIIIDYLKTISRIHLFLYLLFIYYVLTYFLVEYSLYDYNHFIRNFTKDILVSLIIIYFISNKIDNFRFTIKILFFAYLIEIIFGLLQLYPSIYMPGSTVEYASSLPTGFMNNINDFGFVLSLIVPYILFVYENKKLKLVLLFSIFIIIIFIGSIVAFICFNLSLIVYFIIKKQLKKMILIYIISAIFLLIGSSIHLIPQTIVSKLYNIKKIVNYVNPNASSIALTGSARHKHEVISILLAKLQDTNYIGIGANQSYSVLKQNSDKLHEKNFSVHSFFVQMLAETGIYFFIIFLLFYLYLLMKSFHIYLYYKNKNIYLSNIAISNSTGLMVFIFASNSPSSSFHIYTTWILFGLVISTISVSNNSIKVKN